MEREQIRISRRGDRQGQHLIPLDIQILIAMQLYHAAMISAKSITEQQSISFSVPSVVYQMGRCHTHARHLRFLITAAANRTTTAKILLRFGEIPIY